MKLLLLSFFEYKKLNDIFLPCFLISCSNPSLLTFIFVLFFRKCIFPGAEQYRSDCDIKSATNGTENLLYKHQNMDSPNSVISRSPLQMRQASPFPLESTNRRYVTAPAPNPQDRHRSSGKYLYCIFFFSTAYSPLPPFHFQRMNEKRKRIREKKNHFDAVYRITNEYQLYIRFYEMYIFGRCFTAYDIMSTCQLKQTI